MGNGQPGTKFCFGVRENGPWNRKRPGSTRPVCSTVPTVWDVSQTSSPVLFVSLGGGGGKEE
jgi:hypothetical protein